MDTLLRGQKPAEMIPFSLDGPVVYFPIRHHSPACARHLERIIDEYEPDCILVEGPENANDLIPVLRAVDSLFPSTKQTDLGSDFLLVFGINAQKRCHIPEILVVFGNIAFSTGI